VTAKTVQLPYKIWGTLLAVSGNNYRFLKDQDPMRRMNCMRRWRIPEDNIVSVY